MLATSLYKRALGLLTEFESPLPASKPGDVSGRTRTASLCAVDVFLIAGRSHLTQKLQQTDGYQVE